jgi:hypothetical protein
MQTNIPILKLFNNTENYFDQTDKVLEENREKIIFYLEQIKNYSESQTAVYLKAYDYFCIFKFDYDNTTATEELYDMGRLELCTMLQKYLYVYLNCTGNFKYRLLADKIYRKEMARMGKSSWNRRIRFGFLLVTSLFSTPWSYFIKEKKMDMMEGYFAMLNNKMPRAWHKEFKRELSWIVVLILSLIFIIY